MKRSEVKPKEKDRNWSLLLPQGSDSMVSDQQDSRMGVSGEMGAEFLVVSVVKESEKSEERELARL